MHRTEFFFMNQVAGDSNKCKSSILSTELLIIVHVSLFLDTVDFIKVTNVNRDIFNSLNSSWHELQRLVTSSPRAAVISNTSLKSCYFHFHLISLERCRLVLGALTNSRFRFHDLRFNNSLNLLQFIERIDRIHDLTNLSGEGDIIQFSFADGPSSRSNDIQYSNHLEIPGGSVRLFRRPISSLYPGRDESTLHVVGVDMDSSCVWLCRVAAITGSHRLDIKAGSTRSDVLRVPNGSKRGTWTDLCPANEDPSNQYSPLYLVEYICN
jgi:hypothetical protein